MLKTLVPIAAALALAGSAAAQTPPAAVTDLGPGMVGVYYAPPKTGGPVVLIVGGSEGGFLGSSAAAKALAEQGFGALALAYFKAPGLPQTLEDIPLETFTGALDWLSARPEVARRRIGMIGVSKGAEAALLVASRDPRVCAVVAGVASNVAWIGVRPPTFATDRPSWTWRGEPVPFAPYDFTKFAGGIRGIYEGGLAKAPPEAVIPVERIGGPILLVSGRADKLWPSTPMSEAIMARLDAAKFRYAHSHLAYDDAGHGAFGRPFATLPTEAALAAAGGTPEGNQAARVDSWPKVVAFLDTNLRGKGCAPLR